MIRISSIRYNNVFRSISNVVFLSLSRHTDKHYEWVNVLALYFFYSLSFADYWKVDFVGIFFNLSNNVSRWNIFDKVLTLGNHIVLWWIRFLFSSILEPLNNNENTIFSRLIFPVFDIFQQNSSVVMQSFDCHTWNVKSTWITNYF